MKSLTIIEVVTMDVRLGAETEPPIDEPDIEHDQSHVYSQDRGLVDRIVDPFKAPQQAELLLLAEAEIAAAAEACKLWEPLPKTPEPC